MGNWRTEIEPPESIDYTDCTVYGEPKPRAAHRHVVTDDHSELDRLLVRRQAHPAETTYRGRAE
jgi:hypothetical protein